MKYDDLHLTDIRLAENDYWYDAVPTDNSRPYIRPVKVGTTRYLYIYDTNTSTWAYLQMTNA